MQRIDIDDPAVDMDASQRLLYQGKLFTGEVAEYQGEALISLDGYTEGIQDGPTLEWFPDGTKRSEGVMRMGFVSGEYLEWHPNGTLASRQVFSEDGKRLKEEYKWDVQGNPTRTWRDSDA
ncbi:MULTISPECIES: toxin-antitoxin system YwqK family antitoxin [Streptomyces]|uniref:Uncharacterized protein n=1 Tax=Streptomyces morookaense TaxID=1970 RepID=A0A7Y7B9Z0_STRMO|nr:MULTISPECIES: hypothetical protein [Streptomyces]MCC2275384.1 hypothetical protein [Streptomyces sp. ET3-23]NVK81696.1 hypothetical protein [Streptomyces morookaense]